MIDYFKGIYGVNLLVRIHGSSLYKGSIVGIISVFVYLAIVLQWNPNGRYVDAEDDLDHPYGVGVLVSSVTFLIIFRANNGYQRYWEACGAIHHFMSKWIDATIQTGVFHLQNKHYDAARPPSFFDHDELNKLNLTRARIRHGWGRDSSEMRLKSVFDCEKEIGHRMEASTTGGSRHVPPFSSSYQPPSPPPPSPTSPGRKTLGGSSANANKSPISGMLGGHWGIVLPTPDQATSAMLSRVSTNAEYFPSAKFPNRNFAHRPNDRTPPLFLQELAHLSSLLCAVALSTLRNDIETGESVLDMYVPGSPWPVSDPDKLPRHVRNEFQHKIHFVTLLRHWLGKDRLPKYRSKYNAARPLLIIGGVSDAEIEFLQKARGAHAKVNLALGWLLDLLIREHLYGSTGEVHGAIISRLVQFFSDGMLFYNQARKIMYIPFPFPHAQLSVFYTIVMCFAIPFLMDQYTNILWIGSLLTFLTVTCLVGLHEVARELENPFRNVPNELPACTLQAMYNETLVTMFSGYNPDSFWDAEMYQPALEAMAMAKVYNGVTKDDTKENPTKETSKETSNITAILEMPTLDEITGITGITASEEDSLKDESPKEVPQIRRKKVTFSDKVETSNDVATELRQVLAKQALEIEKLVGLLDKEDGKKDDDRGGGNGLTGSISSWISSSVSENVEKKK